MNPLRALHKALTARHRTPATVPTPASEPAPAPQWNISSEQLIADRIAETTAGHTEDIGRLFFDGDTCHLPDGTIGAAVTGPWGVITGDPDALRLLADALHLFADTAEFAQQLQHLDH